MHKVIALYDTPPNPEAFRKHYEEVHIPLLAKMPGVVRMNYTFDIKRPNGDPSFFCIYEAYFETEADMIAGRQTVEGQATIADMANYERGDFWVFHFPIVECEMDNK